MRIVILGAGQVGSTLAKNLASESNDVTVIDLNLDLLRELQHRLDIQTVHGSAAHPHILIMAGIQQADMLIAVTNSDEINMIGCQIAYSLFQTPTKIARIRSPYYYNYPQLFCNPHIPVDVFITPEKLITQHIEQLIDHPGATQVYEFANGKILLVTIKAKATSWIVGHTLQQINQHLLPQGAYICALFHDNMSVASSDHRRIMPDDEVLFMAPPQAIKPALITLGCDTQPNYRVIIAGGGHIGSSLAQSLEKKYRIKVIERDLLRARELAASLHRGTVLQGDIADKSLLLNENIEFTDVFCAVTNDDEANIMACLQARRLGARHTMAIVNRAAYVELIHDSGIDHAISPQMLTIGTILAKLRRGNMIKVYRLKHDDAEAIELIVHGDEHTSQVVGRCMHEIDLPPHCSITAIIRNDIVLMPATDINLESGDHVIMLLLQKRYLRQVESLFQVDLI